MTGVVRGRAEQVRDLIMLCVMGFWILYGGGAVIQLFTSGAKVLESLPPFYFWGIPLAPYTALYAPWKTLPCASPDPPPIPPEAPGCRLTNDAPDRATQIEGTTPCATPRSPSQQRQCSR